MMGIMKDDTELFRQFVDNEDFKRWLGGVVFEVAYEGGGEVIPIQCNSDQQVYLNPLGKCTYGHI